MYSCCSLSLLLVTLAQRRRKLCLYWTKFRVINPHWMWWKLPISWWLMRSRQGLDIIFILILWWICLKYWVNVLIPCSEGRERKGKGGKKGDRKGKGKGKGGGPHMKKGKGSRKSVGKMKRGKKWSSENVYSQCIALWYYGCSVWAITMKTHIAAFSSVTWSLLVLKKSWFLQFLDFHLHWCSWFCSVLPVSRLDTKPWSFSMFILCK